MGLQNLCTNLKSDFDLNGINEIYFLKSQWEPFDPCDKKITISTTFIIYRLIFASYFIITLFGTLIVTEGSSLGFWPIYLTHWSYLIQTIYAILAFCVVMGAKWEEAQPPRWGQGEDEFIGYTYTSQLPGVTKFTWILFNIASMLPFFVTLVYWIAVYDGEPGNTSEAVTNYVLHAVNSVLALTDALIVAIPVRFVHSLFGLLVLFTYVIFTIIYEVAGGAYEGGGDYIYKVLNWKDPISAGIVSMLCVPLGLICHLVFAWGVTKCRIQLANQFASKYTSL